MLRVRRIVNPGSATLWVLQGARPRQSRRPRHCRLLHRLGTHHILANICLKCLASRADLTFQGKYAWGEAESLLFGTKFRSADVLILPSPTAPGENPGLPIAIDFVVTGPFKITNKAGRKSSRHSASLSTAITAAGEANKTRDNRRKVHLFYFLAFPGVPCPV